MRIKNCHITLILVSLLMTAVAGCGQSTSNANDQDKDKFISNTPELAVKDYFQAVNEKDCIKMADLTTDNLNLTGKQGASRSEELEACQQSFTIVQGEPPLNEVKIDDTELGDKRAAVWGELTIKNDVKQVTDKFIVRLIVEEGAWKLDKITYSDALMPSDLQ